MAEQETWAVVKATGKVSLENRLTKQIPRQSPCQTERLKSTKPTSQNVWVCAKSLQVSLTLCYPMDLACRVPLSMGFSRKVYWSGLPGPPPGDLPNPGIEPATLMSPALAGRFSTTRPPGKAINQNRPEILFKQKGDRNIVNSRNRVA